MKKRVFSLAICLLLSVCTISVLFNGVKALSGDGIVEVDVSPRGTFLHAIEGYPYHGAGDRTFDENLNMSVITGSNYYTVEAPTIVDLQAEGFTEGDKIIISYTAGIYFAGTNNPSNPDITPWGRLDENNLLWGGLLGVFSTTSTLNGIESFDRIPGAVESGTEIYDTPKTKWMDILQNLSYKLSSKGVRWYSGQENTNIQYDFKIAPAYGFEITIPRNARFLFISCIDDLYYDNLGEIKVTIEKDTDLDGIPDHWEKNGIDVDEDGTVDLDLPMLGADWEHKDVFVECDWGNFGGVNTGAFDAAVNLVVDSFANAPVNNPDNVNGINLHIISSEGVGNYPEVISWNDFYNIKNAFFGNPDERAESTIINAKKLVFHYCLFANMQVGNASGRGEWPGNDFLVTLGSSPERDDLAATFMHELGHNLGLHHGGNEPLNYKPNYISVMNYMFQLDSYGTGRSLDFSVGNHNPLVESNLNENSGIGEAVKTVWRLTNGSVAISAGNVAIDWNADRNITGNVQMNLNNFPQEPSANDCEVLKDYNDWGNLFYRFRGTSAFTRGAQEDSHAELTLEEIVAMKEEAKNRIEVPIPESYVQYNQVLSFGLKKGDWFEYSVIWSGGDPESYYAVGFKGEVVAVSNKTIEIQWESEDVSGKTSTYVEIYHVILGGHTVNIIPSDVEVGHSFSSEDHGVIDVDGEEYYEYAGSTRHLLWAIEDFGTIHWDKETGLLVQSDTEVGELHRKMLLEQTNAWENETNGLDLILVAAVGIVLVGILIILLIFFRRKNKEEKKQANKITK